MNYLTRHYPPKICDHKSGITALWTVRFRGRERFFPPTSGLAKLTWSVVEVGVHNPNCPLKNWFNVNPKTRFCVHKLFEWTIDFHVGNRRHHEPKQIGRKHPAGWCQFVKVLKLKKKFITHLYLLMCSDTKRLAWTQKTLGHVEGFGLL